MTASLRQKRIGRELVPPDSATRRTYVSQQLEAIRMMRETIRPPQSPEDYALIEAVAPLQLGNRLDDCFVISICNVVHQNPALVEAVRQTARQNEMAEQLAPILEGQVDHVADVRNLLPSEFHSGHQDIEEAARLVINGIVDPFDDMLIHQEQKCTTPGCVEPSC